MRALIVTADAFAAAIIKVILAEENLICDTTELGEDGLEIGKLCDYDVILVDLMRPDIQGYEVLRRLRATRITMPILILSDQPELNDQIKGLGFGADDFLTKPLMLANSSRASRRSFAVPRATWSQ